jgi:hypothetical protein
MQSNAQLKMTTIDDWMKSYNVGCSSHPEIVQSFFCDDVNCKDHQQRLFCLECIVTDFKHSHPRAKISAVLQYGIKEWQNTIEQYYALNHILEVNYPKISNLVKYLDNEDLMKTNMSVKPPSHKVGEDVERFFE